jgi:hypothetical protein
VLLTAKAIVPPLQMPVPVPRYTRPPAHPVTKPHRHSDPPRPTSILPSFHFANSNGNDHLNSWRNNKPHRIWEDDPIEHLGFCDGLTTAANAHVIKGVRAQACLPPISSTARHSAVHTNTYRHSTGDMVRFIINYYVVSLLRFMLIDRHMMLPCLIPKTTMRI